MAVTGRACLLASFLALGGMGGCSAPPELVVSDEARLDDRVWVELARGDLDAALLAAATLSDGGLRERARLDLVAAREGRAAALVTALEQGSWLAARYRASGQAADEQLRQASRAEGSGAALALERARRAPSSREMLARAKAAQSDPIGAAEARAIEVEALLQAGRFADADERLPDPPPTARLALLRRRLDRLCARHAAVVDGVCADLAQGWAVPASVALLEDALLRQPSRTREAQAVQALDGASLAGAPLLRARERLRAILDARAGQLDSAVARLAALDPREPEEDEALRRWGRRLESAEAGTIEERLDSDPQRLAGRDLLLKRIADEWDLAARLSYDEAGEGEATDLDGFVARLDEAADTLPGRPSLAALPRREYGIFGAMLDTAPLAAVLPDAVVVGGQALFMPPELTWFDRVGCVEVELPGELGRYAQCLVRRTRVAGLQASLGARIAGAGLDRLVWLDLDELEREERATRSAGTGRALGALPAADAAERRSLREPLDVGERLIRLAREDAGPDYDARLLETLALHERQHIVDFQEFVAKGATAQVWTLLGAGLLPGAVRTEIERRAHLYALREAADPRIALAEAVARLPVEGRALGDEHSVAYASLVRDLVELLDQPRLPDGRTPEELGLDRGRVLLQQLDRVPPESLRALARAIPD